MTLRLGVPPGVGDVYWALCKLQALRAARGAQHVTLCVQQTSLTRALSWADMVDFVDATAEVGFKPNDRALTTGYSDEPMYALPLRRGPRRQSTIHRRAILLADREKQRVPIDAVLWPNAVVDAGRHLREWMPELELDLSFKVRTAPGPSGRVVVYASSVGINEAWTRLEPTYWAQLITELAEATGQVPTLIGAPWDAAFRAQILCQVEDLLGKTTLPEVAGVLERAAVVVGVISGMTILANHFRTPTIALHADKHSTGFVRAWVAGDAPYEPIAAAAIPAPAALARRAASFMRRAEAA